MAALFYEGLGPKSGRCLTLGQGGSLPFSKTDGLPDLQTSRTRDALPSSAALGDGGFGSAMSGTIHAARSPGRALRRNTDTGAGVPTSMSASAWIMLTLWIAGVAVGYGLRSYISYRRRKRERQKRFSAPRSSGAVTPFKNMDASEQDDVPRVRTSPPTMVD